MRLTVLGGSAAGPNTGQGCSGLLVQTTTTRLVIDLGPGTLPELRRHADFRTLTGIVVSHLHLDHVLDLFALRFALAYNPVPPPRLMPLWLPPGGVAFLDRVAAAFAEPAAAPTYFSSVFQIAEYDPTTTLTIGNTRVNFTATVHYVACWAIRVGSTDSGSDLVFTGDTGPAAGLHTFAAGASVLVAEAGSLEPEGVDPPRRGHLTAPEAADLANLAGVATLVLVHLWEEHGFDRYRQEATAIFPGRVEIGRPGLHLEW